MSEEMRKEFEEWIIKSNATGRVPSFIMKNDNGAYIDPQASDLWLSWQVSREAMRPIKLPVAPKINHVDAYDYYYDGVHDTMIAIQQAGHKVEE